MGQKSGINQRYDGKGNMKELEEKVREGHGRRPRKVISGVTRKVVGLRNFLVWLEDGREK